MLHYNVLQMEGFKMSISLRLAEKEAKLFKSFAARWSRTNEL